MRSGARTCRGRSGSRTFAARIAAYGVRTLASAQGATEGAFGFLFGAGAIVIVPLLYGALGFVGGLLTALFHNLAAKFVGGVVLELDPKPSA